jgi:hypothetical protein
MAAPHILDLPPDVRHFYRYQSAKHLEWLKPVIFEYKIYIPTAKELNDPRECKPRFARLTRDEMSDFLLRSHHKRNPHATLEELIAARRDIDKMLWSWTEEEGLTELSKALYAHSENTRIFSMSKRWNNFAMWAKYADDHRGYCLEFAKVGIFNAARPVRYDDSYAFDLRQSKEDATFAWWFCKSPDWRSEEEIRVALMSYVSQSCPIEPQGLTRILLGAKMTDVDRHQILTWAAQRTPPLTVMDVRFDALTQELQLVPIAAFAELG